MNPRELVFSQDAVEAQKANQIYREIVEKANVAILANERTIVKGLFLGVSNFFNWYLILLIWLRRFRIFFQNGSSVIRSRASILLIIGGTFHSQKRETGIKRG